MSWSAAICWTSRTWWATCPSRPSRSHATQTPISSSRSLIYTSGSASRAGSATFTWSAFRCSIAIRQRTYIIYSASSSTRSTQIGTSSCSTHHRTTRTRWLGATLVSSLASRGALSSMCCACGARHIRSTSSSSRQLKVSTAAPMSRTSIRSLFISSRSTTWSSRWASNVRRVFNFYKQYRHPIIAHTLEKHLEKLPSDMWWVITYAVAPVVDEINITFAKLQSRSLLVAQ